MHNDVTLLVTLTPPLESVKLLMDDCLLIFLLCGFQVTFVILCSQALFKLGIYAVGTVNMKKSDFPKECDPAVLLGKKKKGKKDADTVREKPELGKCRIAYFGVATLVSWHSKTKKAFSVLTTVPHDIYCGANEEREKKERDDGLEPGSLGRCTLQTCSQVASNNKPHIVNYYNKWKAKVDKHNQMCSELSTNVITRRWPVSLWSDLLDSNTVNVYYLYRMATGWEKRYPQRKGGRVLWARRLCEGLCMESIVERQNNPKGIGRKAIDAIRYLELTGFLPPRNPTSNYRGGSAAVSEVNIAGGSFVGGGEDEFAEVEYRPARGQKERAARVRCGKCRYTHLAPLTSTRCDDCTKFICLTHTSKLVVTKRSVCTDCLAPMNEPYRRKDPSVIKHEQNLTSSVKVARPPDDDDLFSPPAPKRGKEASGKIRQRPVAKSTRSNIGVNRHRRPRERADDHSNDEEQPEEGSESDLSVGRHFMDNGSESISSIGDMSGLLDPAAVSTPLLPLAKKKPASRSRSVTPLPPSTARPVQAAKKALPRSAAPAPQSAARSVTATKSAQNRWVCFIFLVFLYSFILNRLGSPQGDLFLPDFSGPTPLGTTCPVFVFCLLSSSLFVFFCLRLSLFVSVPDRWSCPYNDSGSY